jgi:NAD(P)-dependent dehydrogenase (short-subunit alcohol dehydrogenase family)
MKLLENKVAIVTGAGSGIGREVAKIYAAEGATVIVSDIIESNGKETVEQIKGRSGQAIFVKADSSRPSDNKMLVRTAIERFGALHIACNNAGIGGHLSPTGDYPIDGWDKVISVNLSGVFYGMRYQIPSMLTSGGGVIINMASILGKVGSKFSPAYVAAKHGIVGLTKTAALEYADKNIRINSVGPAYITTPLITNALSEEMISRLVTLHPIGRLGKPEEVAELVLWLSSAKSSFVTGSYYAIDGGYLSQ